jgi:hypothetical protein
MTTELLSIIPVLPSADLERDIAWYKEKLVDNPVAIVPPIPVI